MTPTIPPKSRRQQEIQRLVKQRRDLRKQWKRASVEERVGIDLLQTDLKGRLGRLRRAENLRTRRKRKERARTTFYKDPFRFVKGLFTKEKSSNIGLYGHGALELPVSSLTEEYKCTKVRLNMTLTESQDGMISGCPRLATGRKWMPSEAVQQAKSALRHGDIVGQVQHGRGGFGLGASRPTWHKATSIQRRKLVVSQVRHQEEADRCAKAVSQSKQGQWTSWENLEHQSSHGRIFGKWKEDKLASSSEPPMMFFPRQEPTPVVWRRSFLCTLSDPATLRHILTGCKTSLSQGRYTWRHNQVLRQLAITLEGRRTTNNALPPPMPRHSKTTPFVRAGQPQQSHLQEWKQPS
ncbi:hypothetical protein AAFF_G00193880 [Aldrovandia affinis]|uniref:Uncharacterized protein n=1 Tax=Aldrovandia affinis TaxID=143900 RepID=A0AAD7SXA9_9TELE|nr:hypothetical protein AAFF_G00193880 [Aldrovandia affinis]